MKKREGWSQYTPQEKPTLQATISLDIVFIEGNDNAGYILEVNGDSSGIHGFVEATKHAKGEASLRHSMGKIRAHDNPEYWALVDKHKAFFEKIDLLIQDGSLGPTGKKIARKIDNEVHDTLSKSTMATNAILNDADIESLAHRKDLQTPLIAGYAPRVYEKGSSPHSTTGYWVLKPRDGVGGRGIQIVEDYIFSLILEGDELASNNFIAQEYVRARKADNDTRDGYYPSSLRVLLDFAYYDDSERIEPLTMFIYQRASQRSFTHLGIAHSRKSAIVNLAQGARALEASSREKRIAERLVRIVARRLCSKVMEDRSLLEQTKRAQEFSWDDAEEEKLFGTTQA